MGSMASPLTIISAEPLKQSVVVGSSSSLFRMYSRTTQAGSKSLLWKTRTEKDKKRPLTVVAAIGDVSADGTPYLIAGAAAVALIGTMLHGSLILPTTRDPDRTTPNRVRSRPRTPKPATHPSLAGNSHGEAGIFLGTKARLYFSLKLQRELSKFASAAKEQELQSCSLKRRHTR